jgi:hypothetical protein
MIRRAYWIAALLFAALVLSKFSPQTGFTSLIRFGETWETRRHPALEGLPIATVPASNGYDGQFYAQIALDPLLREEGLSQRIDAPAYRAGRILVPATSFVLGIGQTRWILHVYALLNVACWFALAWLLRSHLNDGTWADFARWTGCLFSMGALESVRQSLVDLPALLLLALAAASHQRTRFAASTAWLALGNLAKEINLLGMIALKCDHLLDSTLRKRAILSLLLGAIPFALWAAYVKARLPGPWISGATGNFSWPLLGLIEQARLSASELASGNFDGRHSFALLAMTGLVLQLIVLWRSPQLQSPWWRIGAAFSILFLFLGSWVWSGYWAVCRVALPMTVAFNLLLPATRWFCPLWIVGNLTILHGVWRFL